VGGPERRERKEGREREREYKFPLLEESLCEHHPSHLTILHPGRIFRSKTLAQTHMHHPDAATPRPAPSSERPLKSLILCQLVLADSVVPLGSRQGLTRPDATFVAFSTVTALTAETKFAPHTLGVSRARGPSPRRCAVHVSGLDRERTARGSSIPIFDPFQADLQIPALNLQIAGASSQSA